MKVLGEGGHGRVYKAFDLESQRFVAIKTMTVNLSNQLKFEREFTLMQRMNREGQVGFPTLYKKFQDDKYYYLVMEYLGSSLSKLVCTRNQRKFSLKTIIMIALQFIKRLQVLHQAGFIHRDLKPQNAVIGKGRTG